MVYQFDKNTTAELLEKLEKDDIVEIRGEDLINLLEKSGGSKGRKPIEINISQFKEVIDRWQKGEITARQAMQSLQLKPNTFYRRIRELKERSSKEMIDIKGDIQDLKNRVHEDTKEMKNAVDDLTDAMDMEREIRLGKIAAEIDQAKEVVAMKHAVRKETKEFKKK